LSFVLQRVGAQAECALGVLTCTPREYVIGTANTEWGAAGRSGVRVDIARQDSRRRARLGCARRHGAAHQVCMPQPADSHLWSECCRSRAGLCFGATPRVRSGALHSHDGCCRSSYTAAYTVELHCGCALRAVQGAVHAPFGLLQGRVRTLARPSEGREHRIRRTPVRCLSVLRTCSRSLLRYAGSSRSKILLTRLSGSTSTRMGARPA
jgi:hypothetical protein